MAKIEEFFMNEDDPDSGLAIFDRYCTKYIDLFEGDFDDEDEE